MEKIDLHVHTCCSDGNLSIDEVLRLANKNDLKTISITDHETIINLINYYELEKQYNIDIIPGIEIPAEIPKLHIVGYGIKDIKYMENVMLDLRKENEEYSKETINILKTEGVNVSYEAVKKLSEQEIITYRDVVKFLYTNGYVSDPRDAYKRYIGKGTRAYVPAKTFTVAEILALIERCQGISVLAHPFTISKEINLEELIANMRKQGLSGIEIYPPKITQLQLMQYNYLAKKYGLIKTTGTDFHNSNYDVLGVEVEDGYMNDIKKVLKKGGFNNGK